MWKAMGDPTPIFCASRSSGWPTACQRLPSTYIESSVPADHVAAYMPCTHKQGETFSFLQCNILAGFIQWHYLIISTLYLYASWCSNSHVSNSRPAARHLIVCGLWEVAKNCCNLHRHSHRNRHRKVSQEIRQGFSHPKMFKAGIQVRTARRWKVEDAVQEAETRLKDGGSVHKRRSCATILSNSHMSAEVTQQNHQT